MVIIAQYQPPSPVKIVMPIDSPSSVLSRIRQLIATPSISSVSPQFDQSNRAVIDMLAGWLEEAGFAVQIIPLPQQPDKANLIATLDRKSVV